MGQVTDVLPNNISATAITIFYQGTVYSADDINKGLRVALKIAKEGSNRKLENECSVLQHMMKSKVPGVTQCIDTCSLNNKYAIVLTPVASVDAISSFSSFATTSVSPAIIYNACENVVSSLVSMLGAGVVTSDVQVDTFKFYTQ